MLNIESLKAGRIYSFRHIGEVETVAYRKGEDGREYAPEWLKCATITREAAFKGNLACPESYANALAKNGDAPVGKEPWFNWTKRNGIVAHKQTGAAYLALVNPQAIKTTYFVNGVLATDAQSEAIRQWKKSKGEFGVFAVFGLDKVEYTGELPG